MYRVCGAVGVRGLIWWILYQPRPVSDLYTVQVRYIAMLYLYTVQCIGTSCSSVSVQVRYIAMLYLYTVQCIGTACSSVSVQVR